MNREVYLEWEALRKAKMCIAKLQLLVWVGRLAVKSADNAFVAECVVARS